MPPRLMEASTTFCRRTEDQFYTPSITSVVNYDIPSNSQNYPHSVGRAAQAGRCGLAISLANQYEVGNYIKIEKLIGKGIPEFPFYKEEDRLVLLELSTKTKRLVASEIRESRGKIVRRILKSIL
ncbi:hypothetical protein M0R45_033158 [Rubus argutus]|uniref:Uncharacterized protein n=1 Tax=Rubus argutus TaxID=59490 RepID=A0AAW1WMI8_RUBAR